MRLVALIALAGCTAPALEEDVVYDDRLGESGLMDIYMPDDAGPHPAVLFIHGGTWRAGSKEHFRRGGARLARSGYVAASINYRLLPDGVFPNNLNDCVCALAFLRAHATEYSIDPDRIAVMGYSAGAHLTSLVALASDHPELPTDCAAANGQPVAPPAAAISASGPQDMVLWWNEMDDKETVEGIFGGSLAEKPHAYDLGSPRYHVKAGAPPFLILHDALDFGGAHAFRDALIATGNAASLLVVEGSLHILEQQDDPGFYEGGVSSETPVAWIAIEDFLSRTIGGGAWH
ncbi:MAG TPA: alpha/beta hydrolase [Kofleriaceae bacterium]|nr:alpha/beta hydrolase [Kofleriaceae bacterium]